MRNKLGFSLLLCAGLAVAFAARAENSLFQFEAVSPKAYTPAYLGNGAIGLVTSPLAVAASRCFLAGVYDETPGDVPRIVSAPAWNQIGIYNGAHWLNTEADSPPVESYRQTLDMYDGVLHTRYIWTQDNRKIGVRAEEFVSRDRSDSAAVRVTITPEFSGEIKLRIGLLNWPAPRRYGLATITQLDPAAQNDQRLIWYSGILQIGNTGERTTNGSALLWLLGRAPGTHVQVGEAIAAQWNATAAVIAHKEPAGETAELTLAAKPGRSYTITLYAALLTSGARAHREEAARRIAAELRRQGWDALLSRHTAAWRRLWTSDILVEGNPALQRTIHSMLFYLLGSVRKDLDTSTAPMGLSSAGYYGHIFWDADTFLFPPLLILHPDLARPMVAFRSRTREAARRNAKLNGFAGAMYPWEAGPDGAEATPRFAGQNAKYENHINGDVALAAWQHWLATGNRQWLEHNCWPILRDTADFWVSRVSCNSRARRYEIGKVVAVNESLIGVNNDAWTNAIAKKNLELATIAARAVNQKPNPKWQEIANAMYIPESDSSLLWFPLGMRFSGEQTRHAIEWMQQWIHRSETGAMMGGEFYPILAAQLGDRKSIGEMLRPLSAAYLRPPFQVIAETPDNQNINFITGAGAFLQQFVFGYTGLRLTNNGLERQFPPVLPPGVSKLTLKNITVRGKLETLVFTNRSSLP
jgi:trehalose/maltose hydrolase-like predicted phosphorylase